MEPEVSHWRGLLEIEILRGPHLVLADAGGNDGLALRDAVDLFDDVVRLDELALAIVVHRILLLELGQVRQPLGTIALEAGALAVQRERAQRLRQHAHVAPLHALDLVDLGAVDVEVRDGLGARRELRRHAGDAIVKTRADGDQEVAVVDRVVGEGRAVHAQHAHRQRIGGVHGADAHERGDHRNVESLGELAQLLRCIAIDHAATGVDQRPLRFAQHLEEMIGLGAVDDVGSQGLEALAVARHGQRARALELARPVLHVLRNIDDHRTGATGARDLEGGAHGGFELVRDR